MSKVTQLYYVCNLCGKKELVESTNLVIKGDQKHGTYILAYPNYYMEILPDVHICSRCFNIVLQAHNEEMTTKIVEMFQELCGGTTDGQLCPYDDCCHDLAIPQEAWYVCAHCKRPFYARACDGDFEDYHCEIPKEGASMPATAAVARDLGPSWGTPKETP